MQHKFSRTELLIGREGLDVLAASRVAVFGLGGVGSYTVEALARAGVGSLLLVDYDEICLTNVNRQLHALHSTVGEAKVDVMRERVLDINPWARVETVKEFYSPANGERILAGEFSYVADAMDTVTAKVDLVARCRARGIPVISCMGAGNRLDARGLRVADIAETTVCPLARAMRKALRKRGITGGVKVVYSPLPALVPDKAENDCRDNCICPGGEANCTRKRQIPGSISFVPAVAGLLMAGEVINDLLRQGGVSVNC